MIKNKNLNKGFTLIELLVVISIIALLSSVVLASLSTVRVKAMNTRIAQDLRQFEIAQQMYFDSNGFYASADVDNSSFAVNQDSSGFSAKDLNVFSTNIALAQTYTDAKCNSFVAAANTLVTAKFLASVPKHPKDDGATVCYKYWRNSVSNPTFTVAYTDLINSTKRVGVISGDITDTNLLAAYNGTGGTPSVAYPRNSTLTGPPTVTNLGDGIIGITKGIKSSNDY